MARAIIGGFIGVVFALTVAALLSSYSNGALIRALGRAVPAVSLMVQGSADFDKSAPIPNSETASICSLSKIVLRRMRAS
jgi:hypothetical protein